MAENLITGYIDEDILYVRRGIFAGECKLFDVEYYRKNIEGIINHINSLNIRFDKPLVEIKTELVYGGGILPFYIAMRATFNPLHIESINRRLFEELRYGISELKNENNLLKQEIDKLSRHKTYVIFQHKILLGRNWFDVKNINIKLARWRGIILSFEVINDSIIFEISLYNPMYQVIHVTTGSYDKKNTGSRYHIDSIVHSAVKKSDTVEADKHYPILWHDIYGKRNGCLFVIDEFTGF
jgi:hypothetical protein